MQHTGSIHVCESLIAEHRQMETLLAALQQSFGTGEPGAVQQMMARIRPAMDLHFACEEQALFPAVAPYHPMDLMEAEHDELMALRASILSMLEKMADRLAPDIAEWAVLQETGHRFVEEMLDHIGREDAGIFPACEQALSESEKQAVIEAMSALRAGSALHSPDH